jgi:hypothetical protein
MARSVIGALDDTGDIQAMEREEHTNDIDAGTLAPPDVRDAAAEAARQLQRRAASRQWTRVAIASVRATQALPRGCAIVLRCVARTRAGLVVAERLAIVHVAGDVVRPATAADVRGLAMLTTDQLLGRVHEALPRLREWFDEVQRAHEAAIDAHVAREEALRDRRTAAAPVQHGLFDRRAVAEADRRSALDAGLHVDASERIRQLAHGRPLELHLVPAGVLVLWC